MNKFFILIIILIIIVTWVGYNSFMIYGTAMSKKTIICPIIECPVCPEIITSSKDDVFSYQNCEYERMCEFGGYCSACPETYETELKACQDLLLLEREN